MQYWVPSAAQPALTVPLPQGKAALQWGAAVDARCTVTISLPYNNIYGMGERYDGIDQKGRRVKIEVEEKFCNQGKKSYCPAPFFFTDTDFSCCVISGAVVSFDFCTVGRITVEMPQGSRLALNVGTPQTLIADYMSLSGPPALPPDWVFGPWISANHWDSQAKAEEQISILRQYDYPASVLVLEAWSDEATFYIFRGAHYTPKPNGEAFDLSDFDFTSSPWPDPKAMIQRLHSAGLRLVLWQVPVYKKQSEDEVQNLQNDLDRADAAARALCVQNADGTPYQIPQGHWFAGSMIPDFTNPETEKAWFGKRRYLLELGVDGFKTDGGEFVCSDGVRFHDGRNGAQARNEYPQMYTGAYTRFLGRNHVLFSRAGYMGQHTTPCHWGGDQQSTNDELCHVLSAGLSAALSGMIFWGFDLAGFAGPLPSVDLYRRASMFSCFTPIMQWHSEPDGGQFRELMPGGEGNNERSPWNMAATYGTPALIKEMRFWHWLRINLQPYLRSTARQCVAYNCPMMRPLVYDWNTPQSRTVQDEYMLGDALLVAPLLEENATTRMVYLPQGTWYALFTGQRFDGEQTIRSTEAMRFPVFVRGGTLLPLCAESYLALGQPIAGWPNSEEKLTLLMAGESGESSWIQDGLPLTCVWDANGTMFAPKLPTQTTIYRMK